MSRFSAWLHLFLFGSTGLLTSAFVFAQTTRTGSSSGSPLWCYCVCFPFWFLAAYYWTKHYYVRNSTLGGVLGFVFAFIFSGLAIIAMILDYLYRQVSGNTIETGPCPYCGKSKIISTGNSPQPHAYQFQCPHCRQFLGVGGYTPSSVGLPSRWDALSQLQEQRNRGLISEEEFEQQRKDILKDS